MGKFTYSLLFVLYAFLASCQPAAQSKQKEDYDCKNCGMPSLEFPQWHAKIALKDKNYWFCSPRCMFARYYQMKAGEAQKIWVKDYYTQKFIDAKQAYFVIGSKTLGPMGPDLVPLQDNKSAQDFSQEHKGKNILHFTAITNQVVQDINKQ